MYSGSTWRNPSTLPCWRACSSCYRCEDKGRYAKCNHCSGRHDPDAKRDPYYIDDHCRCSEGVLQYRLQNGKLIRKGFLTSPFKGSVVTDAETQDEQDWNNYIAEQREKYNDPNWDPIRFNDGTSTHEWTKKQRRNR